MATAATTHDNAGASAGAARHKPARTIGELCLLGITLLSWSGLMRLAAPEDAEAFPLADGLMSPMLALGILVGLAALWRGGELLLRVEGGLLVGLAFGALLASARTRTLPGIELFGVEGFAGGARISQAGILGVILIGAVIMEAIITRGRSIRETQYGVFLIAGAVLLSIVELALAWLVPRTQAMTGAVLIPDVPLSFVSLALQYVAILVFCAGFASIARARRMALLAAIGLVVRVVLASRGY